VLRSWLSCLVKGASTSESGIADFVPSRNM
jgi:hypothetical protein